MRESKDEIRKFLKRRRWLKTLMWRIISTATTFTVAYIVTGSLEAGGIIALIETGIKTIQYYFHERGWEVYTRRKIKEIKLKWRKKQNNQKAKAKISH